MASRAIFFIDGENLTFRYQAMLGEFTPDRDVAHVQDVFAWTFRAANRFDLQCVRLNYYTSAVASDDRLAELADMIAAQAWEVRGGPGHIALTPHIAKKPSKGHKSRLVDIAITKDIMRAALATDIETIVLFTGDGDFTQVVQDITRNTDKQIFVAALSSGLAPELKRAADAFTYLDDLFFSNAKPLR